ncbi:MAG: gamma-glutamyl-gamma-aminobutyrate hydrolase family protein [Bacteroidota bacterium]
MPGKGCRLMVIGITDPMRDDATYLNYVSLVHRWMPGAEVQKLSCVTGNFSEIGHCDAVLLSGGGDVHPKFYGRDDAAGTAREVSIGRDLFEFDIIKEVMERGLPALAICRGAQVFNVALGGSLFPDIEEAGFPSHRRGDATERLHGVAVTAGSFLHGVVGVERGMINTSHHQAVDTVGRGLAVSARSDDGVVEGLEWASPAGRPFLLLLQWHPERLSDTGSPFAKNVMERFGAAIASRKSV